MVKAVPRTDDHHPPNKDLSLDAASQRTPLQADDVLESISDAFYALDHEWRFTYINRVAEAWWGRSRSELLGRHFWSEFPQAVGSIAHEAHLTAVHQQRVVRLETISPIVGYWIDLSLFPCASGLAVYFRDIRERKRAEARQEILMSELNHRVKNVLAAVQAIAAQTLRGPGVSEDAREQFTSRLIALAKANELVVGGASQGASLHRVAMHVTTPYGGSNSGRFLVDGPITHLRPAAVTTIALALHELTTNSAKYGALSVPNGRVELHWAVVMEGTEQRFRLHWREVGGPEVSPPKKLGFGSRLLQRGLASELRAAVLVDYLPTGLVCTVDAPLADVAADLSAADVATYVTAPQNVDGCALVPERFASH